MIDLENYQFEVVEIPPKKLLLVNEYTVLDLATEMSLDPEKVTGFMNGIASMLKVDSNFKLMCEAAPFLNTTPQFSKYRSNSPLINQLARTYDNGLLLTSIQRTKLTLLEQEIDNSKIILEKGQLIFRGTTNIVLSKWLDQGYNPEFISTTLSLPKSVVFSKRTAHKSGGKRVVLCLVLKEKTPVMFTNRGKFINEFECLFSRNARLNIIKGHPIYGDFEFVEAELLF